jgi:hypothetical protein
MIEDLINDVNFLNKNILVLKGDFLTIGYDNNAEMNAIS